MPKIKNRILYKGYISPAPGKLKKKAKLLLAKVYSGCRRNNIGESKKKKTKCAKIAWSIVKKRYR